MADNGSNGSNGLTAMAITVIVSLVVVGAVLMPIVDSATTTTEIIDIPDTENPDPVGGLRLAYSEDVTIEKTLVFTLKGGGVSITGDYALSGFSDNGILFGSDSYSLILRDGSMIESINGSGSQVETVTVTVTGGQVNGVPYTFLYYPSADGTYANYQSWEHDNGPSYAVGNFAGVTVQSKEGAVTDSNPYGFVAEVQSEDGITTEVNYNIPSGGE